MNNPYEPPGSVAKPVRSSILHSFLVASALAIVGGLLTYGFVKLETGNTRLSLNTSLYGVLFGYAVGVVIAFNKIERTI